MNEEASRGRPRQVTDDQIFDAFAHTISEEGPDNLSMNKVATRLNMTGPALGYRFGNKHGLLQAFAARQPSATGEYLTSVAEQFPSQREAITESLVGLIAGMTTRAEVANNLALLHLDLTDETLRPHAIEGAEVVRKHLQGLLNNAGLRDGDQVRVAAELQTIWAGTITNWAIDGTDSLENTMRYWIQQVLDRELPPLAGKRPSVPADRRRSRVVRAGA
jgi:AcrR family transcriptional regulator